jgi:Flp pilus assembly protein CpaB
MAESGPTTIFTNTRLLIAGLIVGLVGVVLSFWVINSTVQTQTGGTIEVAYMVRSLEKGEKLTDNHVGFVRVPSLYAKAVEKLVRRDNFDKEDLYKGKVALRTLYAGEPLSVHEFGERVSEVNRINPRLGTKAKTVEVNSREVPKEYLKIGTIVELRGRFKFDERIGKAPTPALLVFDRVRILLINGEAKAPSKDVTNVTLELSPQAVDWFLTHERYLAGNLSIEIPEQVDSTKNAAGAGLAEVGKEVPESTKEAVRAGLEAVAAPKKVE